MSAKALKGKENPSALDSVVVQVDGGTAAETTGTNPTFRLVVIHNRGWKKLWMTSEGDVQLFRKEGP